MNVQRHPSTKINRLLNVKQMVFLKKIKEVFSVSLNNEIIITL